MDIPPEVFEESQKCCKNSQKSCRIWTRKFETGKNENKDYALVMAHGMGAGGALFALSLDELTRYSTVYCIDLPGNQPNIFMHFRWDYWLLSVIHLLNSMFIFNHHRFCQKLT